MGAGGLANFPLGEQTRGHDYQANGVRRIMEGFIMDAVLGFPQKRLLRVGEAARILNVSRWTVYRWVEAGRLGGTRLGAGSLRIFSHTVTALIDLHYVGVTAPLSVERPESLNLVEQKSVRPQDISNDRSRLREFATA